jgi:hypothetical protein
MSISSRGGYLVRYAIAIACVALVVLPIEVVDVR